MRGQGATEYLVLLAVVLIIALVGIALLGFFPGTVTDSQITESEIYWKSASPISVVETRATGFVGENNSYPYIRMRNSGSYPVRITKVFANGAQLTTWSCNPAANCPQGVTTSPNSIADFFYLSPGEEKYFNPTWITTPHTYHIEFTQAMVAQKCSDSANPDSGRVVVNSFGFEYVQYVESQQITKREIGARPLIMRCGPIGGPS